MTEFANIDWFGRWGTSVFSENTAIFAFVNIRAPDNFSGNWVFHSLKFY